ncbi:MAG: hypothetical protein ACDS79_14245, partial [Enterobacteriaceae bacterium]
DQHHKDQDGYNDKHEETSCFAFHVSRTTVRLLLMSISAITGEFALKARATQDSDIKKPR